MIVGIISYLLTSCTAGGRTAENRPRKQRGEGLIQLYEVKPMIYNQRSIEDLHRDGAHFVMCGYEIAAVAKIGKHPPKVKRR